MNSIDAKSVNRAELRRSLSTLEQQPSVTLWPRIVDVYRQQRRRRMVRRGLVVTLPLLLIGAVTYFFSPSLRLAQIDWQTQAQKLELEFHDIHARENFFLDAAIESELDALDQELQDAYDQKASREEINRLWQQRSELLMRLIQTQREKRVVTRI